MDPEKLLDLLLASPEYLSLVEGLKKGYSQQAIYGLSGSTKTYVAAGLRQHTGRPLLILVPTAHGAEKVRDDLRTLLPDREIHVFPVMELLPFEIMAHSPEVMAQRLSVLEKLARGEDLTVVAPITALLRSLPPAELFVQSCLTIRWGDRIDLEPLLRDLVARGYERVELVEGRGQFSVRGGILDLYPLTATDPWRIELFDDEVDSIRAFDIATQRSTGKIKEAFVPPAREFILPCDGLQEASRAIRRELEATLHRLERQDKGESAARLREKVEGHLERLADCAYFEGVEQYAPFFYDEAATLLDYFPRDCLLVLDEPARLKEAAEEIDLHNRQRQVSWLEHGGLLPSQAKLYLSYPDLAYAIRKRRSIEFSLLLKKVPGSDPVNIVSVSTKPMQVFHGQWAMFLDELGRWKDGRYRTLLITATPERAIKLRDSLVEGGVLAAVVSWPSLPETAQILIAPGTIETGFQWPGLRFTVVTDGEIYGHPKKRRRVPAKETTKDAVRVTHYRDLNVGDYVVHVNHGIGKYLGVQTLEVGGVSKDYLFIKYEGADRLYVPTDQIQLIQKYVGAEGHEPKLYKLGGTEWSKVKTRVKESIQKMAIELLRLQAIRESTPGFGFGPDTVWQSEFEDAFKYEETPDQLQATEEIKRDLEKARPMDRLLCGDVGYGKTEVAIRAAFKAVENSKQVAVLVPTTILAQQHYNTFRERFGGYPVRIDLLSRFRTAREQELTLQALKNGEVDVLIGTHRLLGDDVRFKDLGLLIVDEEQRFGVGHKEKIKLLKANVDVLTLTATPIPRTLHMSLVGLRDMSVIESPPEDRFPVETYVAEYNEELIRDAISRELYRGGQVYYLHNRVATIERAATKLQALVPNARLVVAHGQMKEDHLENVMIDFLDGEYDVLVCTTIIESGLDIPNVNTIIVEEADHLGLAQLYQLRGRVGRSNRLAHAYFLYKRDKVLTEVAEKRLQAIREFTEFGSGFKIAMRDLEIRGAGNILGPEQHGFIISVGFDLYCQLLEQAVGELKGEKVVEEPEPSIELTVDAYISDGYIGDPKQKIETYQKIMAIRSPEDAHDVEEEMEDRFGAAPRPVQNLLAIARIKSLAKAAGIAGINQIKDRVTCKFAVPAKLTPDRLAPLNRRYRGRIQASAGKVPALIIKAQGWKPEDLLAALEDILPQLRTLVDADKGWYN
ncbi:MAG: transcription-repair coupling factor [Actinobacteria bacterium]|nr:transcription-repair coupling factor [Actinomycetota bacterium]